ncbi:hypothetical protein LCGC14_1756190 [marine sediment metagenome]|uniref:Core-binding (CB) domain-containing protein n=1 Tax=marine sediment metagenome TaxID=412755 RepID=A0A0F9H2G2_9ZZZZ
MSESNDIKRIQVGGRVVIYPRGKTGIWTADFWHNGQHVRKSLRTRNRKLAVSRATTIAAGLEAGAYQVDRPTTIRGAGEAYLDYLRTEGRAARTITRYHGEIGTLMCFAEARGVSKINRIDMVLVDAYRAERIIDHDPSTVYHETVVIKQLFKWAKKRGLITVNPIADYELNKPPRKRKSCASGSADAGHRGTR